MYKHSVILGIPFTLTYHIWTNMPHVWNYTWKTAPYRKIFMNYATAILLVNAVNIIYSLAFEEYCDRNSHIYDLNGRNAYELRRIINDTNQKHLKTVDG